MEPQSFYWIDLAIAISILVLFTVSYLTRRLSYFNWLLYWVGCAVGAMWEIPFYFIGPDFSPDPLYVLRAPIPYPLFLLHFLHCFWDGGLFLTGVLLVHLLLRDPHFARFRWEELIILLAWGGLQELGVELISVGSSGWAFVPHWWNPVMFAFRGGNITLIPQLVWVAAPVVFYMIALKVRASLSRA
jgi:hypothetical protein